MALDLGPISLTLQVESGDFDRKLDQAVSKIDEVTKATDKAGKARLDVAPTGTRDLDAAAKSADGVAKSLDRASDSAGKVKAPTGLSPALDSSAKSASTLATELDKAGTEAQQLGGSGSGLGGLDSALSGVVSTAKGMVPALGAAAAATAVFTKGWDRLTGIDNARFKLQGLGHTTKSTADIMSSAMDSVKGTAYGFGDAASLAAGAVAATGAQGEELTQILTTIADSAAISGRSLGDMGLIFNQVAASGTLMGDDLNQLLDSGIPVLTFLADELGVTAKEVKDLASEGEISFEIFESAMRNNLGGAAQEMGQSVTGAISNLSAAVGRLGAEAMSGGFSMLPDVVGGATSAVDSLTSGVSAFSGMMEKVPAPVMSVASALLAVNAGSKLLGTELGQKLLGHITGVGDGAKGMGANVVGAFRDMGRAYKSSAAPLLAVSANHRKAADAAKMHALTSTGAFETIGYVSKTAAHSFGSASNSIIGHMRGMGGAVTSGVGSIVNALGGPLNLAIAGATFAISAYINANNRAKEAQEAMAKAAGDSAEAQVALYEAVEGTTGALEGQGLAAAARVAKNELAGLVEMGEAYSGWIRKVDTDTNVWERMFNIGGQWERDKKVALDIKEEYEALEDALKNVGGTTDELNDIVAEGGPVYNALIESLRASGDAGSRTADQLESTRSTIGGIVDAAQEVDPAARAAGEAIETIADSAGDADKMLSGMVKALEVMGLIPKDTQETYFELAAAVREVAEAAAEVAKWEDGALGAGLFKDDGTLEETNQNAEELAGYLGELGGLFRSLAADGEDVHAAFDKHIAPALDDLQRRFQLTDEQVENLRKQFSLVPDELTVLMSLEGTDGAVEELGKVWTTLYQLEEGATVNVGVLTDSAAAMLEGLGYQVEELANGTYEVTVGTGQMQSDLETLIQQTSALDELIFKVTSPRQIMITEDQITEDTRAKLEEMGAYISSPDLNGEVSVTFPEGHHIMRVLSEIGISLVNLDGELVVDTADVDAAKARLDEMKIASRIEDGLLIIESNDAEVMQRLIELGALVLDPLTGELEIAHNIPEVDDLVSHLRGNAEAGAKMHVEATDNTDEVNKNVNNARANTEKGAKGHHQVTDNAADVERNIRTRLVKTTRSEHQVNVTYVDPRGGGSRGFYRGGQIPRLAGGGVPYGVPGRGYRLPTSGPGTGRVDGILGVDGAGQPTAWVNRGEYVTNEQATENHLPALEAINANNPALAIAALTRDLQRLEDGGRVSQKVKSDLMQYHGTPYIFGGWGPAGTDCSGAVSMGVNSFLGLDPFDSRTSTMGMADWLAAKGAQPGRGDGNGLVVGWLNGGPGGGHTAMRLPDGTYIESGGNTGGGLHIGGPAGPLEGRGFTDWAHFPASGGSEMDPFDGYGDGGTEIGGSGPNIGRNSFTREFQSIDTQDGLSGVGSTIGRSFSIPGLASNRTTVGGAIGGGASAGVMSVASQLENTFGAHGFSTQAEGFLNQGIPSWDVWLKVSPETIEAFNKLGEAEANLENQANSVREAEEDLAEARKTLTEITGDEVKISTNAARKIRDAEDALNKAREEGKADKIADAEKKLARAREDGAAEIAKNDEKRAKDIQKATENVTKAEQSLRQEREKHERAIADLRQAEIDFEVAKAMAPIEAFRGWADGIVSGFNALAEALGRLDEVIRETNSVVVLAQERHVSEAQARHNAIRAQQDQIRMQRDHRRQAHADMMSVQQAEWDLAMARHEANQTAGASEVDLSRIRQQGIWDVWQTASQADQNAILSAQTVALMDAQLHLARQQQAYNQQQQQYAASVAAIDLEFAQREAEIQAQYLALATQELALVQAGAAGILGEGTHALQQKAQGTEQKASGLFGLIGNVIMGAAGVLLAPATGGASLLLTAQAVAGGIGNVADIAAGSAKEKAWEEEAQREFDALPEDIQAAIVAHEAGIPIAAAAGALMGAAGGSRDDAALVQRSVQSAFSVGLDVAIARAQAQLRAAEAERARQERELAVQERQNALDELRARIELDLGSFDEENELAELLDLAKMQYEEMLQENKQLAELNKNLSPKNQSVLMSIGGSGWGDGAGGPSLADMSAGFGGITAGMVNPWSSLSVEDQWGNTSKGRMWAPWMDETDGSATWGGGITGLPETVGEGRYQALVDAKFAEMLAQAGHVEGIDEMAATSNAIAEKIDNTNALLDGVLAALGGLTAGTNVETQFTGPVNLTERQTDQLAAQLAESLAKA